MYIQENREYKILVARGSSSKIAMTFVVDGSKPI